MESLAKKIKLEKGEAFGVKGWLKDLRERDVTKFEKSKSYTVPNLMKILAGDLSGIESFRSVIQEKRESFRRKNYYVDINMTATTIEIKEAFRTVDIYGVVFYGHGGSGDLVGYGMPQDKNEIQKLIDKKELDNYYLKATQIKINYRLSHLELFACGAGANNNNAEVKYKWKQFVSDSGTYFAPESGVSSLFPYGTPPIIGKILEYW